MKKRLTNKQVMEKIEVIEKKLPNGELKKIQDNTKEIKDKLRMFY
tara:strand:+ start:472 stop:606 length:135 start_codon:yes stop_codon:yes gene_type:complete